MRQIEKHFSVPRNRSIREFPRLTKIQFTLTVAMLCCASLGLPGVEFSRGYIQRWLGEGGRIPEKTAQRIFRVTNEILKAGEVKPADAQADMFDGVEVAAV
jgi:hypothetical protein